MFTLEEIKFPMQPTIEEASRTLYLFEYQCCMCHTPQRAAFPGFGLYDTHPFHCEPLHMLYETLQQFNENSFYSDYTTNFKDINL